MTTKQMIECDACGKTIPFDEASGWLSVKTIVASAEKLAEYHQAQDEGVLTLDAGELCSLNCMVSWANTRDQMKRLDDGGDGE